MSAQPIALVSVAEYLAAERRQHEKHEFFDGEIALQAGASIAHNLITANIIGILHRQLRSRPTPPRLKMPQPNIIGILHRQLRSSPCTVLPSDMRIRYGS